MRKAGTVDTAASIAGWVPRPGGKAPCDTCDGPPVDHFSVTPRPSLGFFGHRSIFKTSDGLHPSDV